MDKLSEMLTESLGYKLNEAGNESAGTSILTAAEKKQFDIVYNFVKKYNFAYWRENLGAYLDYKTALVLLPLIKERFGLGMDYMDVKTQTFFRSGVRDVERILEPSRIESFILYSNVATSKEWADMEKLGAIRDLSIEVKNPDGCRINVSLVKPIAFKDAYNFCENFKKKYKRCKSATCDATENINRYKSRGHNVSDLIDEYKNTPQSHFQFDIQF